jgi:hypothetical protein
MRNGYSTAIMLIGLALVCLIGWAASHAPASAPAASANFTPAPPAPPEPTLSPVPSCTGNELGVAYVTGQRIGDNNFGIVAIWDKSPADCSLTGAVVFTGLGPAGRPVTPEYQVAMSGLLTARGTRPREGMQLSAGERAAPLIVSAEYRLDPANHNRRCTRPLEPASWRLTIESGESLTVANADPQATAKSAHGLPADHGLLTCGGQLDPPNPVVVPTHG